eukprot:354104-Chlamydomonas_euryale.AAC.2
MVPPTLPHHAATVPPTLSPFAASPPRSSPQAAVEANLPVLGGARHASRCGAAQEAARRPRRGACALRQANAQPLGGGVRRRQRRGRHARRGTDAGVCVGGVGRLEGEGH